MSKILDMVGVYNSFLLGNCPVSEMIECWQGLSELEMELVKMQLESSRLKVSDFERFVEATEGGKQMSYDEFGQLIALEDSNVPIELDVLGLQDTHYFITGRNHIVSAGPKTGKTQFILNCLISWSQTCIIHYFSEESKSIWVSRLKRLNSLGINLPLFRLYSDPSYTLGSIIQQIKCSSPGDIVVVDTLRRYARYTDENDSISVQTGMSPLIRAALECGVTLIVLHHSSKAAVEGKRRSAASAGAGSNALSGIFDNCIQLTKSIGSPILKLTAEVRDYDAEPIALQWFNNLLKPFTANFNIDKPKETSKSKILSSIGSDWISCSEIASIWPDIKLTTLKNTLSTLVSSGNLDAEVSGKTRSQRYRLPQG